MSGAEVDVLIDACMNATASLGSLISRKSLGDDAGEVLSELVDKLGDLEGAIHEFAEKYGLSQAIDDRAYVAEVLGATRLEEDDG